MCSGNPSKAPAIEAYLMRLVEGLAVKGDAVNVVRGSGNVFRDLGLKNSDVLQLKSLLATEIIRTLDRDGLSGRTASTRTGVAAADFSRIRNADLGRFTIDRLITIINRLGSEVDVRVRVRRAPYLGRTVLRRSTAS